MKLPYINKLTLFNIYNASDQCSTQVASKCVLAATRLLIFSQKNKPNQCLDFLLNFSLKASVFKLHTPKRKKIKPTKL